MSAFSDYLLTLNPGVYWALNSTDGATDLSGHNRDGTGSGGITIGGHSATYPPIPGETDNTCTDFSGIGQYITASGYSPFVNGSRFTAVFWVYRDTLKATGDILVAGSGVDNPRLVASASQTQVTWRPQDAGTLNRWADNMLPTGAWFLVGLLFDEPSDSIRLDINGLQVSQQAQTFGYATPGDIILGSRGGVAADAALDGKVGHFAAWDRKLSPDERQTLYQLALHGAEPAPTIRRIREKPPLREHIIITTPDGKRYQWATDDPHPRHVLKDLSYGDGVPGGFDQMEGTLPRKPNVDYDDLKRLSTIQVKGVGGHINGEYRLEDIPKASGKEFQISPAAVGWQAALDDNPSCSVIFIDRDLSHWEGMPRARKRVWLTGTKEHVEDGSVQPSNEGTPSLRQVIAIGGGEQAEDWAIENWYDAGEGNYIGYLDVEYQGEETTSGFDAHSALASDEASSDAIYSTDRSTGNDSAGGVTLAGGINEYRYAHLDFRLEDDTQTVRDHTWNWQDVKLWGDHMVPRRGDEPYGNGVFGSDVLEYAIGRWAPMLNTNILPSDFIIEQLEFREKVPLSAIVEEVNRYHLREWAVWEHKTFCWCNRGSGRYWKARTGPTQLQHTGLSGERLLNGVIIKFTDSTGKPMSVGPPFSGAGVEYEELADQDPLNEANQLGIPKWKAFDMGVMSVPELARAVGTLILHQLLQMSNAGSAVIQGYVQDAHTGIWFPYNYVRSGDTISFTDAADTSPRYIIHTKKNQADHTCSIDLDAPPESYEELLARFKLKEVNLGAVGARLLKGAVR